MSMVTGLSMRKPYESGYNQYRRFLVANMDRAVTTRVVLDAFEKIGGDLGLHSPKKVNQTALWSSRYENLMVSPQNPREPQRESFVPTKYQPQKNCEKCASIVFHSYAFDLPWVDWCPIHQSKLTSQCYKCKRSWPSVIELPKRECDVCGVAVPFSLLLRREYNKSPCEYDQLSGLEEIRTTAHPNVFPTAHFELLFEKKNSATRRINAVSSFSLSVLHSLNLVPKRALVYLGKSGFEYQAINSVTFRLEKSEESNLGGPEHLPRALLVDAEQLIGAEIQMALQSGMTHELGSCSHPKKSCVRCASWYLWRLCVKYHYDYEANSEVYKWEKHSEFIYGTSQPFAIPSPGKLTILDKDQEAITSHILQPYVRQEILQQDFRTVFLNIFWYVIHFRAFLGTDDGFSRIDLHSTTPYYAHPLRACPTPYVFRFNGAEGTLYWPEMDLGNCTSDLEFFYSSELKLYKQQSIHDELVTYSRSR